MNFHELCSGRYAGVSIYERGDKIENLRLFHTSKYHMNFFVLEVALVLVPN
jgi:hypothetical protein